MSLPYSGISRPGGHIGRALILQAEAKVLPPRGAWVTKIPVSTCGEFKTTWSVRSFLFLLQNYVNQYKL